MSGQGVLGFPSSLGGRRCLSARRRELSKRFWPVFSSGVPLLSLPVLFPSFDPLAVHFEGLTGPVRRLGSNHAWWIFSCPSWVSYRREIPPTPFAMMNTQLQNTNASTCGRIRQPQGKLLKALNRDTVCAPADVASIRWQDVCSRCQG